MLNGSLRVALESEAVEAIALRLAELLGDPEPAEPLAPRHLAVGVSEAAELLAMSPDHFRRHVLPDLRVVRSGRLRLVPVAELEAWLDRSAARVLAGAPLAHEAVRPHSKRGCGRAQGRAPQTPGRTEP